MYYPKIYVSITTYKNSVISNSEMSVDWPRDGLIRQRTAWKMNTRG